MARAGLAPDAARVAQAQGARLSLAAAVRYAVDDTWPDEPAVLTEPETALAHLVAAGLSNREIAARLHVAERTVEAALRGLRTKLHLRSRAQLAAWSTENLP